MAARFIGWADGPFQAEVGFASLGFAMIGFLAFRAGYRERLAAIVGPSLFHVGRGRVYQMIAAGNFAPGNAGVALYVDVILPAVSFALL